MVRIIFQTLLGLVSAIGGLFLGYLYIENMTDGGNPWLLIVGTPLLIIGAFLLFRAGKSDATVVRKTQLATPTTDESVEPQGGLADRLEQNNQITAEWEKTETARNRLRMLELSADPQKGG